MERTLVEAKAEVVRERVLAGVAALLAAGRPLTFREVAVTAEVPERTVYRYFPTRDDLLAGLYGWANRQLGFDGEPPTTRAGVVALVRRAFRGFDEIAPVIRELLIDPAGVRARVADIAARRRAAVELVRSEVPGLDATTARRVAAAVQVLTLAATWQSLREYWDLDGTEAGETSATAIDLLLDGARALAGSPASTS